MSNSLPPFLATDPDVYEHFMGRWSARLAEPFLEFAGVKPGYRVLDVGCGTGTISLALAKRGAKTVGLDVSEPYLAGARRLRSHPNVTYEHGDACHLQYSTASFDACVSTLAIDVIPEVDLVAAEMRRVTRPGGASLRYIRLLGWQFRARPCVGYREPYSKLRNRLIETGVSP